MARSMRVRDVMTTEVRTVRPDTPVKEVARAMHDARVSGVPVVDDEGRLVGIVTEADLLLLEEEPPVPRGRRRSFLEWFLRPGRFAEVEGRAGGLRAEDVMTREVVTVGPDATVREAVRVLLETGVKRLPVVDEDRRVVGIVSRGDLLGPFLRPDEELEREIREDVLVRTMWIDPDEVKVRVDHGVVTLEGEVEQRSLKEILLELVARVDGVVGVEDRLRYRIDDRKVRPERRDELGWGENWVRTP